MLVVYEICRELSNRLEKRNENESGMTMTVFQVQAIHVAVSPCVGMTMTVFQVENIARV